MSQGWPSVEGGVEVSIEVHSDLKDSEKERSTCRLLVFIGCLSVPDLLSFLCYSAVSTSSRSCAPARSHQELTHSLSPKSMLPVALSEALGISLSEVMDLYYSKSDVEKGTI
jgi:hypothetical protein